jgi:hypothetical protein
VTNSSSPNPRPFEPQSSELPQPELLEAEWPPEWIVQLFSDLEAGAEVQHVQLRSRSDQEGRVTLDQARRSFLDGAALAIQIRYQFDGEAWCDTLMPGAEMTKIIRTRPAH